jgi:DNA processing protein
VTSPPPADPFRSDLFEPAPLPIAVLSDRARLACLRLIRTDHIGPVTYRQLINQYGGAEAALEAVPELARRSGSSRVLQLCPADLAEAELEAAARVGAHPLFTIEPGYPAALAHVDVPPPLLYVKGRIELLSRPMIALVGSRDSSAAGMKLTRALASDLGTAGFVVSSGFARGIDAAAHSAALVSGTVGVMAGGIDIIYPPEHTALYAKICEQGCLISERPPGLNPRAKDFPRRNRIISGISLGVVVVEAALRSGTLITARFAGEQGREVFAVPGHPLDPRGEGTNHLLKTGATLVTCANDIIEALGPITGQQPLTVRGRMLGSGMADRSTLAPKPPGVVSGPTATVTLGHEGGEARSLLINALGPHPVDIDEITRATGLSSRAVQIALIELDLAGRIERHGSQLVSLK